MTKQTDAILILDDEFMVGLALAEELQATGFEVVGPFASAKDADAALDQRLPDAAILDFNLGEGDTSEQLAQKLASLGVPFLFLTGYSSLSFDDEALTRVPQLGKPVDPAIASAELRRLIA